MIELADGTFRRTGNRDVDYLGKAITIRSQSGNPEACIVDCEGSAGAPHRGFRFVSEEGNDSVLEGVTVVNGHGASELGFSAGGAIFCLDASPTIRSCRLLWNHAAAGGGIACISLSTILVDRCSIAYNTAEVGGGIHFALSGSPSVLSSTLVANTSTQNAGGGIYFTGSLPVPTLTIQNSIIAFSPQGEALECADFGHQVVVRAPTFTATPAETGLDALQIRPRFAGIFGRSALLRCGVRGLSPRCRVAVRTRPPPGVWPDRRMVGRLRESDPGDRFELGSNQREPLEDIQGATL